MKVIKMIGRIIRSSTSRSASESSERSQLAVVPTGDRRDSFGTNRHRRELRAHLNGRWTVEAPWHGDECDWWIPFTAEDGKAELTFETKAEANSYLYANKLQKFCRVVQINRWVPPEDLSGGNREESRPPLIHETFDDATAAAQSWTLLYGEPVTVKQTGPREWRLTYSTKRP